MTGILHAPPGQRIRAKLIEGHGHPVVRFELAGVPPDLEGLRRAARQARREPWADMPGQSDVLCALAGARLGDAFLITRVRFGAWPGASRFTGAGVGCSAAWASLTSRAWLALRRQPTC